jgi:hypothetical protein
MNERIRELARQAGLIAPYGSDREGLSDFDYREFAELIVRECSSFLKDTLDDHFAAEQLEEHFRVEE